jgi:hypothetical protein
MSCVFVLAEDYLIILLGLKNESINGPPELGVVLLNKVNIK